jgi:hypothetical protein
MSNRQTTLEPASVVPPEASLEDVKEALMDFLAVASWTKSLQSINAAATTALTELGGNSPRHTNHT